MSTDRCGLRSLVLLLRRISLALFASMVTFAGAELGLRFLLPQVSPLTTRMFRADPELGWILDPGVTSYRPFEIHINLLGMREREILPKQPDSLRLLVIGDSFTFGAVPTEQTYVSVLERMFAEKATPPPTTTIEILNGGVPAYGPDQELIALRRWLPQVTPDVVLLGLFVGNDFTDLMTNAKNNTVVVDGQLAAAGALEQSSSALTFTSLIAHLHLYQLVRKAWVVSGHDAQATQENTQRELGNRFLWREYNMLRLYFVDPTNEAWWQRGLSLMRDVLISFGELTAAHKVPLIVAIFPDSVQVQDGVQQALARQFPQIAKVSLDFERPQRELGRILTELQIPHIDLLSDLRTAARDRELYLPRDTHWNADGNGEAAKILALKLAPIIQQVVAK